MVAARARADAMRAVLTDLLNAGTAIVARIPIMAITITNSIRVKPFDLFFNIYSLILFY
jgi:hypothetical protein